MHTVQFASVGADISSDKRIWPQVEQLGMRLLSLTEPIASGDYVMGAPAAVAALPATGHQPAVVVVVFDLQSVLPKRHDLQRKFGLTPREAEVALLIAAGLSNKRIAQTLDVTVHTAARHCEKILTKLRIHSRKDVRGTITGR